MIGRNLPFYFDFIIISSFSAAATYMVIILLQ